MHAESVAMMNMVERQREVLGVNPHSLWPMHVEWMDIYSTINDALFGAQNTFMTVIYNLLIFTSACACGCGCVCSRKR